MGNEMGCDPWEALEMFVGARGSGSSVTWDGRRLYRAYERATEALGSRPTIPAQPGVREEVQWEVYDPSGDLQASADREADGYHYLAVYSQDGPHKLVKATTFRVDVAVDAFDPDAASGCADDTMPGTADQWRAALTPAATEGGRG